MRRPYWDDVHHRAWLIKHWLTGYIRCLDEHVSGVAFCKRRRYHLGKHRTGNRELWWR